MHIWLHQVQKALELGQTSHLRATLWEFERVREANPENETCCLRCKTIQEACCQHTQEINSKEKCFFLDQ